MLKGLGNLADMAGMMKKVMEMKSRMEEAKEALGREQVEGVAGGGMVKVKVSGKMEVLSIAYERDIINPDQPELLETLTKAALNDAFGKAQALMQARMKEIAGPLDIPGL